MELKPLLLQNGDETTGNITKIFDINTVVQLEGTVLDPQFQTDGGAISLAKVVTTKFGTFESIYVPPCPVHMEESIVVLDDIAVRANNLIRVRQLVEDGERKDSALNKSISNYQSLIVTRLTGKKGIVCRNILGRRVGNTGRAVLLPSYSSDPAEVYMPAHMMRKMQIDDNDIVLVGRDPSIWVGSVEVLRALPHEEDSIRLHPFIFSQFGADCDGDTVWVMKIPDHLQDDMGDQVLKFTKSHQKSIRRASSGLPPAQIDWSSPSEASMSMGVTTGFSVGPQDLLGITDGLERFKEATGKDIGNEAAHISNGLTQQEYAEYLMTINETMLIQKVYLGPVGAAAQKLKLIAGKNKLLIDSANYLSERIQQMLFDVKGSVRGDKEDLRIFFEILDIINLAGKYCSSDKVVTHFEVVDRLEELNFDRKLTTPMIVYMYTAFPLLNTTWEMGVEQHSNVGLDISVVNEAIELGKTLIADASDLSEICKEMAKKIGVNLGTLIANTSDFKSSLSLGIILRDPLYTLINPFSDTQVVKSVKYLDNMLKNGGTNSPRLTDWIFTKSLENEHAEQGTTTRETETTGIQSSGSSGREGKELLGL